MLDTPDEGYAACCEAIDAMDLRGGLPRITAPTLVIAGLRDPATPPEHQRRIAAGDPRRAARRRRTPPTSPNVERPTQVTALHRSAHLADAERRSDEPTA